MRESPTINTTTMPTRTSDWEVGWPTHEAAERYAVMAVPVPAGLVTPKAAGTCSRKMMTAIPRANPSTTGHGT